MTTVLTFNPFGSASASFWMSFIAVFFVLHQLNLRQAQPRTFSRWWKWHVGLVSTMLPAGALFFGGVSLVSPLYNMVFIPWFSVAVVPALFLALLISAVGLAEIIPVWNMVGYLLEPLHWFLPWAETAWYYTSAQMTGCLMLLSATVLFRNLLSNRGFYFFCILAVGYGVCREPFYDWRVDILDVGYGLAVLIERNHHYVLYDTGKRWVGGSIAQSVIEPVLHRRGARQLDGLILSHMDNAHAGGKSWMEEHWKPIWRRASQRLAGYQGCARGEHWSWQGLDFKVLWPMLPVEHTDNIHSCVIKISDKLQKHTLLLTGDITMLSELWLRHSPVSLASEVLIVPHHGSRTSSSRTFVEQVHAEIAIASLAKGSRWHLPAPQVVDRYRASGARWLDTGDAGQISVFFQGKHKWLRILRDKSLMAWYRQMLRKQVE
jgi:competence protein ComEC